MGVQLAGRGSSGGNLAQGAPRRSGGLQGVSYVLIIQGCPHTGNLCLAGAWGDPPPRGANCCVSVCVSRITWGGERPIWQDPGLGQRGGESRFLLSVLPRAPPHPFVYEDEVERVPSPRPMAGIRAEGGKEDGVRERRRLFGSSRRQGGVDLPSRGGDPRGTVLLALISFRPSRELKNETIKTLQVEEMRLVRPRYQVRDGEYLGRRWPRAP